MPLSDSTRMRLRFRWPDRLRGFTILEVMTAIVIITILIAIAVPNFMHMTDRALEKEVMTNMRQLAIMLETYRVDWKEYPSDLLILGNEATAKNYNKALRNPYTGRAGKVGRPNIWAIEYVESGPVGFVGFELLSPSQFRLYGYDKEGRRLKQKGTTFVITNG